ncbi:hypothetical protein B0H10DRAFT_2095096 [Mycena sp. CBHHK59/15]|nr:hypothetical protein B0H10DRAFT_2095096 [Mycena sp. CBHHK59/15]
MKLRGLIYHSQAASHFTSIVVDAGSMWYHDGITTRRACVNNGRFADLRDLQSLHRRSHEEVLCAVIYALK